MRFNMGKTAEKQKQPHEVIQDGFAYQNITPRYQIARQTLLNPMFDGSQKQKFAQAPRQKSNIRRTDEIKSFMRQQIHSEL